MEPTEHYLALTYSSALCQTKAVHSDYFKPAVRPLLQQQCRAVLGAAFTTDHVSTLHSTANIGFCKRY